MIRKGTHAYGTTLVTGAAVLWSTAGLFVRALDLDVWTILAWRSLFAALSLGLVVLLQRRSRTIQALRAMGRPGLCAIPIAFVSMSSYVIALKLTTVANVMIVYATVPFVAAGIAFLWSREKASPRVVAASVFAFIGILVMAGAAPRPQDMLGNAVAFLMTLSFAGQLVMARRYPFLDMAPINAAAAVLCALLFWPLASGGIPSPYQLVVLAMFGTATTAAAYVLFLTGGRYIPSGEAGFIGLLDVILAPFWVWLLFSERPDQTAIIGGGIVLASVLWYFSGQMRTRTSG
jgi:drug/metabolite transporter (DMT)-like permease